MRSNSRLDITHCLIEYEFQGGIFASKIPGFLDKCSKLYSEHYGIWAIEAGDKSGKPIRLSSSKINDWLKSPDSIIVSASADSEIVGYAVAIRTKVPRYGVVTWVTQLVVHVDFRNQGIAKNLLFSLWSSSDHFAWGLVSANPFAVRALEKATRRRCDTKQIIKRKEMLLKVANTHVPYITKETKLVVKNGSSKFDTKFLVDHSELPSRITSASTAVPWTLGELDAGWEWLAFTFNEQQQLQLTKDEIEKMLRASDSIVRDAFARMTLDSSHKWASHDSSEVKFIIKNCNLKPNDSILDVGCGNGRHSILLAELGFDVTGLDYIPTLVDKASKSIQGKNLNCNFRCDDFRSIDLGRKFKAVICLYDVIGSFANPADNFKMIDNLYKHVAPGGTVLISVMNMVLTEKRATNFFSIDTEPDRLFDLQPSNTMETSGNIFNPEFYMIDENSRLVYRKEQFNQGNSLPSELIVRDIRYKPDEIKHLFAAVGFLPKWVRCVQLGNWDTTLEPDNDRAKEVLLLCKKPL